MVEWLDGWLNEKIDGQMDVWLYERMDDGWINR